MPFLVLQYGLMTHNTPPQAANVKPGKLYLVVGAPLSNPKLWNFGRFVRPATYLEDGIWLVGPVDERKALRGANCDGLAPMKASWLVEMDGPSGLDILSPVRPLAPCTAT